MPLNLITAPPAESVTLTMLKSHAVIGITADDTLLSSHIAAGRQFVMAKCDLTMADFPLTAGGNSEIPHPPLASVVAVTCFDTDGDT